MVHARILAEVGFVSETDNIRDISPSGIKGRTALVTQPALTWRDQYSFLLQAGRIPRHG